MKNSQRNSGGIPTRELANSLAAFIEAAEELQHEPFFGPDDKTRLTVRESAIEVVAGDRFHFRSALATFRRFWMNDEPSSFRFICNQIERFDGAHPLLQTAREQFKQARTQNSEIWP